MKLIEFKSHAMAIKSFANKSLQTLFVKGMCSKINPEHSIKLLECMDIINASHHPMDLKAVFGFRFSQKKGSGAGVYSIKISANYRLIFQIEEEGAVFLDYLDYHGKQIRAR